MAKTVELPKAVREKLLMTPMRIVVPQPPESEGD